MKERKQRGDPRGDVERGCDLDGPLSLSPPSRTSGDPSLLPTFPRAAKASHSHPPHLAQTHSCGLGPLTPGPRALPSPSAFTPVSLGGCL